MEARGKTPVAAFLAILLWVATLATSASAHDLEIDTFSLRLTSGSKEVDGQFLLDPELTRPNKEASIEQQQAALLAFIRKHVILRAGSEVVPLELDVRELYVKGGAVPGDSVMVQAELPRIDAPLELSIEAPLPRMAVTVSLDNEESPTILVLREKPSIIYESTTGIKNASGSAPHSGPPESQSLASSALGHIWIGVLHIIPWGLDHILFVIALTIGSLGKMRRLLIELTGFTLAHTVTLALGALEIFSLPSSIVEPIIALSIAAIAVEHLLKLERAGWRLGLVLFFGLIHGLGFAGALLDLGFSGSSFVVFLASFNIGVELGQLVVVCGVLLFAWGLGRWPEKRQLVLRSVAMGVALVGLWMGTERIVENMQAAEAQPRLNESRPINHGGVICPLRVSRLSMYIIPS